MGCGACAFVCERSNIALVDVRDQGIRPTRFDIGCNECSQCIQACPGLGIPKDSRDSSEFLLAELGKNWGPIVEMWEGHAASSEIRYGGSSGGAATAIALYCLENGLAGGVLHIGQDDKLPLLNKTVMSRSLDELLSRTGSRYSPASPCDGLHEIESAASPSVFMGKPCDIQGLRKVERLRPQLREKVTLALGIFCAGTPATVGILNLLARLQVSEEDVEEVRFRGNGWPGSFSVRLKEGAESLQRLSYKESWGFLQAYRPFRCYLCPDGTSEFADISCGDPWYRKPQGNEPGRSLILVRTEKGRKILAAAVKAGYVVVEKVASEVLELSQQGLLQKRRAIWGRLFTMKALGLPVPRFVGFPLFDNWLELPFEEKARSIIGTARRVLQRKYHRPLEY